MGLYGTNFKPAKAEGRKRIPAWKLRQRRSGAKSRKFGKARVIVRERDGWRCRVCRGPGYHCHHVVFRSLGGDDTTENLCMVCAACHDDIHAHRITVTGNANESLLIERAA